MTKHIKLTVEHSDNIIIHISPKGMAQTQFWVIDKTLAKELVTTLQNWLNGA